MGRGYTAPGHSSRVSQEGLGLPTSVRDAPVGSGQSLWVSCILWGRPDAPSVPLETVPSEFVPIALSHLSRVPSQAGGQRGACVSLGPEPVGRAGGLGLCQAEMGAPPSQESPGGLGSGISEAPSRRKQILGLTSPRAAGPPRPAGQLGARAVSLVCFSHHGEAGLQEQDPGSLGVWVPEPAPCLEVRE